MFHAEPLKEPVSRSSAAQVLRDYPLPGDPHDAVASFNELVAEISGEAPASVVAAVIRNFPMPGDSHDAAYSVAELVDGVQRGEISVPVLSNEPVNAVSIVPMPGDAHDAEVQMAEWYASLQPETPSRIRLSD